MNLRIERNRGARTWKSASTAANQAEARDGEKVTKMAKTHED